MSIIPPVTRLTSSIIRILGCNPSHMTLQGTNTYLIGTGHKRILVDTGDPDVSEYIKHLSKVLKDEKASISTIILTHWHHDHVGGVKDVLKIACDKDNNTIPKDCQVYKYLRTDAPDVCPEIPKEVEVKKLQNNQEFEVEGGKVKIIHTPGHTTDHVVLTLPDGSLFSGDCILGEGTAVFEDLLDYMKSLNKILSLKPSVIYPGHGNIIEDPLDKIKYYIKHRNQREEQILDFFVQRPQQKCQAMDIVKVVYKETPESLWPAAAYNVGHHLTKLQKEGKLQYIQDQNEDFYMLPTASKI